MEPIGQIKRSQEGEGIELDEWIKLIKEVDFLEQMEDQKGINPFTYEPVVFEKPFAAYVIDGGERIGSMVLEGDTIQVEGSRDATTQYVATIAEKLGAEFLPD